MQPKNLGWKLAFVGLLLLLAIYAIWAKELRQGIDLKGGHILTFEVQLGKNEGRETVQQAIRVLKRRVDPTGTASLEWKPVGTNRFEVRMPMGTEEARKAKEAYLRGVEELERSNVQRSQVRRIVALQGGEREKAIDEIDKTLQGSLLRQIDGLQGPDREGARAEIADFTRARAETLREVGRASDAAKQAEKKLAEIRAKGSATPQQLQAAQDEVDNAAVAYFEVERKLFQANVNVESLRLALTLYVPRAEATKMIPKRRKARASDYKQQLDKLYETYPLRRHQLKEVVAAYERWAERRMGLDDPADLKRMIARAGVLEFRIAATLPGAQRGTELTDLEYQRLLEQLATEGPLAGRSRNDRFQWFPVRGEGEGLSPDLVITKYAGKKFMLLYHDADFMMLQTGEEGSWKLTARPTLDRINRPAVGFDLDPSGAKRMGVLTSANKGRYMAILLDDEVYSAPVIQATIYDKGIIESGDFTRTEVDELVRTLNAGALRRQVNPDPVSEKTIEPSIGADNRRAGIRAAVWGLIFVAAFMLVYYLAAGAIADMALVMNLVLVLGAMSFIEAVFTLPGIAGVILTIGMAVDANVLIYERLREEQAKTQSMRMAIRNAYSNAASAILDSNATTLITCLILGWVGTEEVRGFAITLGLGVMFSLFTALVVTRWIFQLLVEIGFVKRRIRMLAFIGTPKINWMAKRRIFWAASALLLAAGIVSLTRQGKDVLGLEFSSGTQASLTFKPGAMIHDLEGKEVLPARGIVEGVVRAAAERLATQASPGKEEADAFKRIAETAKVETLVNREKVKEALDRFDANADGVIDAGEWSAGKGEAAYFAYLDADNDGKLTRDELASRLPERSFQVATTVAKADLLKQAVQAAFGADLEMSGRLSFERQKSGPVPDLRVEVDGDNDGMTYISSEFAEKVSPRLRDQFVDMIGGVMFAVRKVSPPLTEPDLADRIRTMRTQPDFERFGFNKTSVIGLEADPGGGGFRSFVVLVLNPNINYHTQRPEWDNFATNELTLLTDAMGRERSIGSLVEFDATIAGETAWRAGFAFVLSWVMIILYLWLRFGSARWGLAAVICLVHDVLIALGMMAISTYLAASAVGKALLIDLPFRIDMAVVAAFLTIIGYSVNDTIVVFDRIRENRGKLTSIDEATVNRSINQTISRTLLTSFTTLIAVVTMYVGGGPGIRPFTYALLVGVIFGTYSSVAIASPLLLGFKHALVGGIVRAAPAAAK